MAADYVADGIYLTLLTVVLFSPATIKRVVTPIVFSVGMLVFYLLDAFFPYGSLGPLQFWANFVVAGVALLARLFSLPIDGFTNHLNISGVHGYFRLVVYWPSVGVQSILIYSVVMVVMAAKLQAPRVRKLIYMLIGIAGTVFLNVVRIFSIAYYGYAYATSGQELDAFHNAVGEVLFPIWIVVFLVLIIRIEDHLTGAGGKGHVKGLMVRRRS
jgi:thaumarchaeosortase